MGDDAGADVEGVGLVADRYPSEAHEPLGPSAGVEGIGVLHGVGRDHELETAVGGPFCGRVVQVDASAAEVDGLVPSVFDLEDPVGRLLWKTPLDGQDLAIGELPGAGAVAHVRIQPEVLVVAECARRVRERVDGIRVQEAGHPVA